jgi:hypothetical protein
MLIANCELLIALPIPNYLKLNSTGHKASLSGP